MFLLKSPTLAHAIITNKRDQARSGSLRRLEETPWNEAVCVVGGGAGVEMHITYIHEVKEG